MIRHFLTAICILLCTAAGAQTFGGLRYGATCQEDSIIDAFGEPDSREGTTTVTYRYGECSYTFDNGRFVDAGLAGKGSAVGTVNGTLAVGDALSRLLAMRIDLESVDYPEGTCRAQYVNEEGRVVQFLIKYDSDRNIVSMNSFTVAGPKERTAAGSSHFYESLPSVETPYFSIASGDSLEDILSFRVDIEFSSYGNGICRVYNKKNHEQYLLRYDLDRHVREILPLVEDTPRKDSGRMLNLPKYPKY